MDYPNQFRRGFIKQTSMGGCFPQLMVIFFAVLGFALTIVSLLNRHWRVNDIEGLVVENVRRSAGLWYKCTEEVNGQISCEDIEKFWAALPMPILCGRIFYIIAVGASGLSIIFLYIGCQFTSFYARKNVLGFNKDANLYKYTAYEYKKKMFIVGGLLNFVSAVFIAITVIWYMVLVADQYFESERFTSNGIVRTNQGQRFIWGYGLYIGWGAFVLQLISTMSCCCVVFDAEDENEEYYEEEYLKAASQRGGERGYRMDDMKVDKNQPMYA